MKYRNTIKILGFLIFFSLFISCIGSYESQDRENLISSFEDNFGFKPPNSVKEIKLKNYGIADATVHWMAFTYDSIVFNKIIIHDQPLEVSIKNSKDFINISKEIEGTWNNPKWFELPKVGAEKIYYKKDFLNHTFSEYYLWINEETQMTFLYVHYFD